MKKLQLKRLKGFTLVELIIVITILAILARIAFVSFQNYVKDARDSNRLESFSTIQKGLDIFFVKVSNYPTPDNPTTLTGGNTQIQMGVLGDNASKLLSIHTTPVDPLTKQNYIYSLGGNGYYYQIAGEKENTNQASFLSKTYAAGENKIALVKGNYQMDPSLPSLIPVKTSVTGSGLFDSNVCFIVDGGSNNFTSTSSNCLKKKDLSFKNLDSGLVGYWDMETLSGTMLKDLSGNGNEGVLSGGMIIGGTGGILGKATKFGIPGDYISITHNTGLNLNENLTITSYINSTSLNGTYSNPILVKGDTLSNRGYYLMLSNQGILYTLNTSASGTTYWKNTQKKCDFTKWYSLTIRKNSTNISVYLNGQIVDSGYIDTKSIYSNNDPIYIGHNNWSSMDIFNGIIDDIKIYNRALSDQEIAQQAKMAGF